MHTTSRLKLDVPDGTDLESGYPADAAQSLGVLDNAALFQSGTLANKPSAASTANGTIYYCTDTGALLLCMANVWVWVNGNSELVGTIKAHGAATVSTDPDGVQRWHICDGSPISRTTYASLYGSIGTAWGTGDGSTTFNLPDLRGVTMVGAGQNGLVTTANYNLASNGGVENVTLSSTQSGVNPNGATGYENQSHTHTFSGSYSPGVAFAVAISGTLSTQSLSSVANNGPYPFPYSAGGFEPYDFTASIGGTTSGESVDHIHGLVGRSADASHTNMQPFATVNHIIKLM